MNWATTGILDIFKKFGPYINILCFRRRRTILPTLTFLIMKRLIYMLVFWLLKRENKKLKDSYPRVKVVSQTNERLVYYLIYSVIVTNSSGFITLRRGRKCSWSWSLECK